jgi:hypothetical protein
MFGRGSCMRYILGYKTNVSFLVTIGGDLIASQETMEAWDTHRTGLYDSTLLA